MSALCLYIPFFFILNSYITYTVNATADYHHVSINLCSSFESSNSSFFKVPEALQAPFPQQKNNTWDSTEYTFLLTKVGNGGKDGNGRMSRWNPGEEPCSPETEESSVSIYLNESYPVDPEYQSDPILVLLYTDYYFTPSGYFYDGHTNIIHHKDNYCLRLSSEEIQVQFCVREGSMNGSQDGRPEELDQNVKHENFLVPKPIPKCCPIGMLHKLNLEVGSYADTHVKCDFLQGTVRSSPSREEPLFKDWEPTATEKSTGRHFNLGSEDHFVKCNGSILLVLGYDPKQSVKSTLPFEQIKILETGEMFSRVGGNNPWIKRRAMYCLDQYIDYGSDSGKPLGVQMMYCDDNPQKELPADVWFYMISLLISTFFLLATVTVYILIWTKEDVHGWTLACFSFSLLMSHVFSLVSWFLSSWTKPAIAFYILNSKICIFVAVMRQFFGLSSFTWMTLVNFDLWLLIKSTVPRERRSRGATNFKRFCCIGFGVPTLVVSISLLIENLFGLFDDRVIRPQYGRVRCDVDTSGEMYHRTIVIMILFTVSLFFSALTLRTLWQANNGIRIAEHSNSRIFRTSAALYRKLFVITGFTWLFTIVNTLAVGHQMTWFTTLTNVYNILQGTGIFWIFVYKREVRVKLADGYTLFNGLFQWWDELGSRFNRRSEARVPEPLHELVPLNRRPLVG